MKTYLPCVPCFVAQTLRTSNMATEDTNVHESILREVMARLSTMDFSRSPAEMGQEVHAVIRELSGNPDPFSELKIDFNQRALDAYPNLKKRVEKSENPLVDAVKIAIAGNAIDFGVASCVKEMSLDDVIEKTLSSPFTVDDFPLFEKALEKAEKILYLGDNTGEIVFDRLLIETLGAERITYVVRGNPVLNDVTMEDAEFTGMTDVVKVIDNGRDYPGTVLSDCSEELLEEFNNADMVISKGQGNYETLSEAGKENMFFLLKVKCRVIASDMGCEIGSNIIRKAA